MAGSQSPGGVFSAFPEKLNRHWRIAALVGVGLAFVVFLSSPGMTSSSFSSDSGSSASHVRGGHAIMTETYNPGPVQPLNPPHGGKLVSLIANKKRADQLLHEISPSLPSLTLTSRQLCDIELLINGGFSPLDGFMTQDVYNSVLDDMRLGPKYHNAVFPVPITLDISEKLAKDVEKGTKLALRDPFFNLIAVFTVTDKWTPDKAREADKAFGTTDESHPAVHYLLYEAGTVYLGGSIEAVRLPQHFDFNEIRRTPAEVRDYVSNTLGWSKFLAFQTRNPMHRAHIELTRLAANKHNLGVLIHPVVGMTKPGDVSYSVRVRCYKAIVASGSYWKKGGVALSLFPLAMRMAGPREALWHAIIRKNYGASHFVVGRDHAGCKSAAGEDFYEAPAAAALANKYADEIGITILGFSALAYVPEMDVYMPKTDVPKGMKTLSISGTKFRAMMARGDPIPEWFSHPDVIKILREVSPPLEQRGFAVFFTGLSGSGKTTITTALIQTLQSLLPTRRLTVLDGDVVRTHLSSNLGFSIADRNTNVARMGWVAGEVVRHGGIAVCSTISPFHESRAESREYVEGTGGGFILVHVSTSVAECAARDVKGLYAKAMAGDIALTGVSHPYENPDKAELTIDAGVVPVEKSVDYIVQYLIHRGYILKDSLPAKYKAIDPEIPLKAAHVLTDSTADPAAALCKDPSKAHMGALIALGDQNEAITRALEARHVSVQEVGTSTIVKAEQDTKAATTAAFVTPLSVPMNEAQLVEAGWNVYYPVKKDMGDSSIVLSNPRMLLYAPTLLRVDPCFKVMVVVPTDSQIPNAAKAVGSTEEEVKQFLGAAKHLKDKFPNRVHLIAPGSSKATEGAKKF